MITTLLKIIKIINSETSPIQIAAGIMFGFMIGLSPLWSLHNAVLLVLILLFRINISAVFLSFGLTALITYLLDPWIIHLGEYLLTHASLQALWTNLYQYDLFQLAHFNHTLALGSFALALLLALPVLFSSYYIIVHYRHYILAWVLKTRFVKALKASRWFQRLQGIYEAVEG